MVKQRKICWPKPDATCVEGGCLYCDQGQWVNISRLRAYCERLQAKGHELMNRGDGKTQPPMKAYQYGAEHGWGNAQTREVERR